MSRLLILATGSYGDYAPYAGLWRALKQYRHQVALAGIARFADLAAAADHADVLAASSGQRVGDHAGGH